MKPIIQNRLTDNKDGTISIHIIRRNGERYTALIDADDLPKVVAYRTWNVLAGRNNRYYCSHVERGNRLLLHRVVLGELPEGAEVAFLDGNSFNCTRKNMLVTNHKTVMQQRCKPTKAISGHRCIRLTSSGWEVKIINNAKVIMKFFRLFSEAKKWRDQTLAGLGVKCDRNGKRTLIPPPAAPSRSRSG